MMLGATVAASATEPAEAPVEARPAALYAPPEDPRELLRVDGEMREYFARWIEPQFSEYERLSALVDAILRPEGLHFVYDASATFDARETFRRRRGNCASYAFLVVAVARAFGFDARFQNIIDASRWDHVNELVVSVQHLDVRVMAEGSLYVVDLIPDVVPRSGHGRMRPIRDRTAFAQFYSNIGFERVVAGQEEQALHYMTLATLADPGNAAAWANRATVLVRQGRLQEAKSCFEKSLRADPRGEAGIDGFVNVLRDLGTPEDLRLADRLSRKAAAIRDRNPYYHHRLAVLALQRDDPASAEQHLRRAIALKDDDPDFYHQWAAVLEQLGRTRDVHRAHRKLAQLEARRAGEPSSIVP